MEKLLQKFRTPIIFFCIGVLSSVIAFWIYLEKHYVPSSDIVEVSSSSDDLDESKNIRIYVGGAVQKPMVCDVKMGSDLFGQIDSCVDFLDSADTEMLKSNLNNLSASSEANSIILISNTSVTNSVAEGVLGSAIASVVNGSCVNINTATLAELDSLPGIGTTYAERIVETRPFSSKSDLKKVKGIGDKTFSKLEPLICL